MDRSGFTLIEIVFALMILTVAILGVGASAGKMLNLAGNAETKARAVEAADGRIQEVQADPRYAQLDSIYVGEEEDLPGLDGFTRVTDIEHVQQSVQDGRTLDYRIVTVAVDGPRLGTPIKRTVIVGEP